MQLEHEKPDTAIYVIHYQPGLLTLSQKKYQNSVIMTPGIVIQENWLVKSMNSLNVNQMLDFIEFDAGIYLLGTGSVAQIPSNEVMITFARLGKSLDFMDSASACRTFNILANEGRSVVAAIIV